ncbi:MAG: hypothetical protein KBF26_03375 [Opitutaceae bacterium]|nr:hypothetical protein [Opitutaceae bacterium]
MNPKPKAGVRTLAQARAFVQAAGVCLVFADKKSALPNLWDVIDLPEKQPGEKGWGQKIGAVWSWKNQLPADYPDEIFYGKGAGGKTVLMTMDYLRQKHYPAFHRPIAACGLLARNIYELIRIEPLTTGALRKAVLKGDPARKAAFTKALIELQVTLNIVRSNDPAITTDTWLRFADQYST